MKKSLTFILLSFHTLCCMGGNTITTAKQPTLDDLDKVISASKEYTRFVLLFRRCGLCVVCSAHSIPDGWDR